MEDKNFQSIVRRVVLFPLTVLLVIMVITIVSCLVGFLDMQQQMINSNVNSLQISMNQLDNLLSQIDNAFIEFWNTNESYSYLINYSKDTPRENYFIYEADTTTWLRNQARAHKEVQGAFACYANMELLLFRGKSNPKVHQYIKTRIQRPEGLFNHWEIITVEGTQYLIKINNYGDFYGGVWMPIKQVYEQLGIYNQNFWGTVYIRDQKFENSIMAEELNDIIKSGAGAGEKIRCGQENYFNYVVTATCKDIFMGILIPQSTVISNIPLVNKAIFAIAFGALFLVPGVALWLQKKIARPVKDIDHAMEIIGEGNMEYRIPLPDKKYYDEFDRLILRFNKMMDELNELEFNLYKTKIKEQRTELKYISQQIRPHFILNALNIIYTYEETEFPLVKKMVLYLTEYFRYIVNLRVDFVQVGRELRHVENYLKIQKERYLERFEYFVEWEAKVEDCMIPPLILQTFVENSMKYGMNNEEKTFIYVLASRANNRLKLMVADTGNGFSQDVLDKIEQFLTTRQAQKELGVGIQNTIERMDILYDQNIEFKVRNALSGGAIVEIYLPLNVE